ncbi:arylacetamide deacetylase-like [Ylistrum balloti]|uniref:arylacetamide deacetylase-like n=1 Tax=Ylistrum balloti TaxID=509963 RepID=UPI002905C5C1|nr:arylacetamide deacetylase-like [Ylistrum balloti]
MVRYSMLMCSLLVVGVTYRVHVIITRPLPPDIQDQTKVRILDEIGRISNHMLDILLSAGLPIGPPVKWLVDSVFSCMVGSMTSHNDDVQIIDQTIQDVHVRVFKPKRPARKANYPTLMYIHGGGWTWLTVNSYSAFLAQLANKTGTLIIAPEYRKAPLHHFPAPYRDCEIVMYQILLGKSGLPVDKYHVMVGGDGSGGNLAAAVAQEFRKKIFMQVLINPALQILDLHIPSYVDNHDVIGGITSPKRQIHQWLLYTKISLSYTSNLMKNSHVSPELRYSKFSSYVNSSQYMPHSLNITNRQTSTAYTYDFESVQTFQGIVTNTTLAPMMQTNLNGIPSAYVISSQYDVIRDEGIMYATRLWESDVKVKLKYYPSTFHGFLLFSTEGPFQLEAGVKALQELSDFIRFQLRGYTS